MTHSAHRYGTVENLADDYTFYARTSRHVNREGCGPKLRKILEIILSEKPVNPGFQPCRQELPGRAGHQGICLQPGQGLRHRLHLRQQGETARGTEKAERGGHGHLHRNRRTHRRDLLHRPRSRPDAAHNASVPGDPRPRPKSSRNPRFWRSRPCAGPRPGAQPADPVGDRSGESGQDDRRKRRVAAGSALPLRHLQHRSLRSAAQGAQIGFITAAPAARSRKNSSGFRGKGGRVQIGSEPGLCFLSPANL